MEIVFSYIFRYYLAVYQCQPDDFTALRTSEVVIHMGGWVPVHPQCLVATRHD